MTDLYLIEITTASPLPTGFSREEKAESLEVGKLVLCYKYSTEKFNKPVTYTSESFFFGADSNLDTITFCLLLFLLFRVGLVDLQKDRSMIFCLL